MANACFFTDYWRQSVLFLRLINYYDFAVETVINNVSNLLIGFNFIFVGL